MRLDKFLTMPSYLTTTAIYPRMFAVHNLESPVTGFYVQLTCQFGEQSSTGDTILPPTMSLTAEKVDMEGAYLLENGEDMFLYVGKVRLRAAPLTPRQRIPSTFLRDVFGVNSFEELEAAKPQLVPRDSDVSKRLLWIVHSLQSRRFGSMPLHVVYNKVEVSSSQAN
jgi:protein transport protein SEC24